MEILSQRKWNKATYRKEKGGGGGGGGLGLGLGGEMRQNGTTRMKEFFIFHVELGEIYHTNLSHECNTAQ